MNRFTYFLYLSGKFLDMLVVGIIWVMIYAPKYGILAKIFNSFGLDLLQESGLLGNPYTAMPAIIFALTLKGAGFGMILFLAAMQNVPGEIYEAAELDGANAWEQFLYITLPLVRPVIFFLVITGTIGALNAFTEIYAMTQGGPNIVVGGYSLGATQLTGYYLFKTFDNGDYGYAAAISYVLLGITLSISYMNMMLYSKEEQ
ncbi:carbohydrate ABC transporter permease [Candidatus Riflebacteria bacterium]